MLSLTMTKGLPGSGKSTDAKERVLNAAPGVVVRINKDDLRDMLHAGRWNGKNEKQVVAARDDLIVQFLSTMVSVIVDDTNLNPIHEKRLRDLAERYGATFKVADFTDVPLNTCIANDLKREKSVGEQVIRDMYNKYLAPPPADPPAWDSALPEAILVDIDGTLARMTDRGPYEWSKVGQDEPIQPIVDLVNILWETNGELMPIFISGRKAVCRSETRDWLIKHVGSWTTRRPLHMRPSSDNREDSLVKRMLFDTEVAGHYNVRFVLDDRQQVVNMWRAMGLTCLQVAPGNF